ncbi:hypothetical protein C2845_PM05G19500 [Panicum miliaceum]|uniref:Uncharacterized protein n=1 Tax=Panicum miliaceum TaxID=4540 RepID=A0A3L6SYG2_PANMI|nr:hypothetical protein C2845_PM05G19500 [Panicum miliaceum]
MKSTHPASVGEGGKPYARQKTDNRNDKLLDFMKKSKKIMHTQNLEASFDQGAGCANSMFGP